MPKTGDNKWEIFTHGGRKPTGIDAIEWAVKMADYGAGELLITSMDADGTKAGYDIALMRAINDRVTIPTIASGGVVTYNTLQMVFYKVVPMQYWQRVFSTLANIQFQKLNNIWLNKASKCACKLIYI